MKKINYSLTVLLFLMACLTTKAQDEKIENEFKQMQTAYKKQEYLSYNIQYLYAKEKAPGIYIDTVNGSYKLNRNRYWGMLDNVEYIQNDSFFIAVYPEEKVILLNSVPPAIQLANANWDSIWTQQKEKIKLSMEEINSKTKIEMNYLNDSIYKKIELWYNSKTRLMEKMIYIMRQPKELTDEMNEEENESGTEEEFVIIEVRISNYTSSAFDKSLLETRRYIQKQEKEYQPSEKYQGFTVLVGSPNLIN